MRPKIILIARTSTTTNGWKRSLQLSEVMISLGNGMGIFTDCCYQFAKIQYKDGEAHSGLCREIASMCGSSLRWTGFPNHRAKTWDFLHIPNWDNRVWGKFGKLSYKLNSVESLQNTQENKHLVFQHLWEMQIDGQNAHCNGEEAESSGIQEELLTLEREEKANQQMTARDNVCQVTWGAWEPTQVGKVSVSSDTRRKDPEQS